MAKFRKHKMFRRAPSKPRAPRPPSGPARAGFTYGYQWSAVQPEPWLRFPLEDQGFKLYPFETSQGMNVLIEDPNYVLRWRVRFLHQLNMGAEMPTLDATRLSVALDWHQENGVNFRRFPFHLSGQSWGAVKFMREASRVNPVEWMNDLVGFWRRIIDDGTQREWSKAPDALWWLDHELKHPDDWYDLRERLWPRDDRHDVEVEDFEDEDGLPPEEPEEGDIVTEDYLRWFQDGRLYASGPDHASAENAVRARANAERFWPNLWVQDDHGGMMLIRGWRWN